MTRILFMGTPDFAVNSLKILHQIGCNLVAVVTQPDRPRGRGQKVSASPVKTAALELNLPVLQPQKIKEAGFSEQLRELKPDLIVVVAFGQILPRSILELPALGCINVHASLLPAYRGAAPIHWAILNGEKETGVTTMLMDQGLDTGDMLLKSKVEIAPTMNYGRLHDVLAPKGAELLAETVRLWPSGQLNPTKQDDLLATYAPLLKHEHEKINWNLAARQILNQIRGLDPWPGAYTDYRGSILKIREASVWPGEIPKTATNTPGRVVQIIRNRGFVVQAGDGSLLVSMVQPAGKTVMSAVNFMNGYSLEVDYVLGATS